MSHFERYEGAKDNLGNDENEWVPIEDLAIDRQPTPDEALMAKEKELALDEDENQKVFEGQSKTSYVDPEDEKALFDEESNWEADVVDGKYDEYRTPVKSVEVNLNPVKSETRRNLSGIEDEKKKDRGEKFHDYPERNIDNSKPKRPQDERDSIRFDEAV